MPLPQQNTAWPPTAIAPISRKYEEFQAWYAGDPDGLASFYRNNRAASVDRPAQYRRGVSGAVARFWWGRPVGDLTKRRDNLHVPLAADLCQASADLLFSEPPTITHPDRKVQARMDEYVDGGLHHVLGESAEYGAALGDSYLRATWAADSGRQGAFPTVVDADQAWPEFRWGQLHAVTFWWEVERRDQVVYRHLERHELDSQGVGVIFHGLYQGRADNLGMLVPLAEHPSTAGLQVNEDGYITTGSPGLAVVHVPNQTPQRLHRKHPVGRHLGRSDLAGVEPELDALDEAYSSWMRDVRLGKGRIIAPNYMLEDNGRGQGATMDIDREVFVGINAAPGQEGAGSGLTINQFAIRVGEHQATVNELVRVILRSAGYSGETFGEDDGGGVRTATEVVASQTRSYRTRDRKIRLMQPAVATIIGKCLAIDAALFGKPTGTTDKVDVEFGDAVQADPESLARTAQALKAAQAASTQTLVRMVHPDWEPTAVDEEVARILREASLVVPDLGPSGGVPPEADEVVDEQPTDLPAGE